MPRRALAGGAQHRRRHPDRDGTRALAHRLLRGPVGPRHSPGRRSGYRSDGDGRADSCRGTRHGPSTRRMVRHPRQRPAGCEAHAKRMSAGGGRRLLSATGRRVREARGARPESPLFPRRRPIMRPAWPACPGRRGGLTYLPVPMGRTAWHGPARFRRTVARRVAAWPGRGSSRGTRARRVSGPVIGDRTDLRIPCGATTLRGPCIERRPVHLKTQA